ncbi:hypothetical protein PGB90_001500 [Kerria lacca]
MNDFSKLCHVISSLPVSIQGRIDRGEVDSIDKLMSKIHLIDRPVKRWSNKTDKNNYNTNNGNNNKDNSQNKH